MTWVVLGILTVHGLIHLMGFAKAFGLAELPQLTHSISRGWGVGWLVAALLVLASAAAFALGYRRFWVLGTAALLVSQAVILSAWSDAWAGTLANAVLLAAVLQRGLVEG
jgi:hypothetical protein